MGEEPGERGWEAEREGGIQRVNGRRGLKLAHNLPSSRPAPHTLLDAMKVHSYKACTTFPFPPRAFSPTFH